MAWLPYAAASSLIGRHPVEERDGGQPRGLGVDAVPAAALDGRELAQRVALAPHLARLPTQPDRGPEPLDGLGEPVDQVAGVRPSLQQVGAPIGRQLGRAAQRPPVLRRRLAMRTARRRLRGRDRRELNDRIDVTRRLGMVRQPGRIGALGPQRVERDPVQSGAAQRLDLVGDGGTGEVVPEGDPVPRLDEHPGREAGVEPVGVLATQRGHQWERHRAGDDRHSLEQRAGLRVEPGGAGHHGVAHRRWQLRPARSQHLGHVEGVAAGSAEERLRVDLVRRRELADRVDGQGRQSQPFDAGRGQAAEDQPQRMVGAELVVPAGHDGEAAGGPHAAGQQHDEVQRGLVGPLQVLDDEQRGPGAQLVEQHGQHLVDRRPASHDLGQRAGGVRRQVGERTERSGGEEALAPTRPHADAGVVSGLIDERTLADAGFSGQEDQSAARGGGLDQSRPQAGLRSLPLQQGRSAHHRLMLTPIRPAMQRAR